MQRKLHPQVAELISGVFASQSQRSSLSVESIRKANDEAYAGLVGPGEEVFSIWNVEFDSDGLKVPVRCYKASDEAPTVVIVFVHGGGWVTGTFESYDTWCRSMAIRSRGLVLNVGYDLAPERTFPRPVNQVLAVLDGLNRWAALEGFEHAPVTIAGDSAGAQIVGSALHQIAERGGQMPEAAAFVYPVTDATMAYESWEQLGDGYRLQRETMEWYWAQYLGCSKVEASHVSARPDISPVNSPYFAYWPRSFVVTAEFDPLKDEGAEMARRIGMAGTPVTFVEVPGQIHGFVRFRKAFTDPVWGSDSVMDLVCNFLKSTP